MFQLWMLGALAIVPLFIFRTKNACGLRSTRFLLFVVVVVAKTRKEKTQLIQNAKVILIHEIWPNFVDKDKFLRSE